MKSQLAICSILAVGLTACSGSFSIGGLDYSGRAETLIEDDLADKIGLGDLDAECQEFLEETVGETSTCTGTAEDGRVIQFETTIEPDEFVDVQTTNFMSAAYIEQLEESALALVVDDETAREGITLECADTSLIVDDLVLVCEIFDDPALVYDATITFEDNTFENFAINVAEEPRS